MQTVKNELGYLSEQDKVKDQRVGDSYSMTATALARSADGVASIVVTASPVLSPKISIIMPAYNEQGKIAKCVMSTTAHLDMLGVPYEIVVVDDGSMDGTRIEALNVRCSNVRVVGYDRNQGKGFALKFGSQHASGDYVFFMDSDTEIEADRVHEYVAILRHYDMAIASKWHPGSRVSSPIVRRILSHAFHNLVMLLTGVRVSDTQSGFKAFRRDAINEIMNLISVKHFAFDVEVLTVAKLLKLRVAELPVNIRLASLFSARYVFRMFIDLLGITYRLRVIRWYQNNLHNEQAHYQSFIRW